MDEKDAKKRSGRRREAPHDRVEEHRTRGAGVSSDDHISHEETRMSNNKGSTESYERHEKQGHDSHQEASSIGQKNNYEILGVSENATEREIEQAFRKKARECHPDFNPDDPHAHEKMTELNLAREKVLAERQKEEFEKANSSEVAASNNSEGDSSGGYVEEKKSQLQLEGKTKEAEGEDSNKVISTLAAADVALNSINEEIEKRTEHMTDSVRYSQKVDTKFAGLSEEQMQQSIEAHDKAFKDFTAKAERAEARAKDAKTDSSRESFTQQAEQAHYRAAQEYEHARLQELTKAQIELRNEKRSNPNSLRAAELQNDVDMLEGHHGLAKRRTDQKAKTIAERQVKEEAPKREKSEKSGTVKNLAITGALIGLQKIEGGGEGDENNPQLMSRAASLGLSAYYTHKTTASFIGQCKEVYGKYLKEVERAAGIREKSLESIKRRQKYIEQQVEEGNISSKQGAEALQRLEVAKAKIEAREYGSTFERIKERQKFIRQQVKERNMSFKQGSEALQRLEVAKIKLKARGRKVLRKEKLEKINSEIQGIKRTFKAIRSKMTRKEAAATGKRVINTAVKATAALGAGLKFLKENGVKKSLAALAGKAKSGLGKAAGGVGTRALKLFNSNPFLLGRRAVPALTSMLALGNGLKISQGVGNFNYGNAQPTTELKKQGGMNAGSILHGAQTAKGIIHGAPKAIGRLADRSKPLSQRLMPNNVANSLKTARQALQAIKAIASSANPVAAALNALKMLAGNMKNGIGGKLNNLANSLPSLSFNKLMQGGISLALSISMIVGLFGGALKSDDASQESVPVTPWGWALALGGPLTFMATTAAIFAVGVEDMTDPQKSASITPIEDGGVISAMGTDEDAKVYDENTTLGWRLDVIRSYMKSGVDPAKIAEFNDQVNEDRSNERELEEAKAKYRRQNMRDPVALASSDMNDSELRNILKQVDIQENGEEHDESKCNNVYHKYGETVKITTSKGKESTTTLNFSAIKDEAKKISRQRECIDNGLEKIREVLDDPWTDANAWKNASPSSGFYGRETQVTVQGEKEYFMLDLITAAAYMYHDPKDGSPRWYWSEGFLWWEDGVGVQLDKLLRATKGEKYGGNIVSYDYYTYTVNRLTLVDVPTEVEEPQPTGTPIVTTVMVPTLTSVPHEGRGYIFNYRPVDDSEKFDVWKKHSSGELMLTEGTPPADDGYLPISVPQADGGTVNAYAVRESKDFALARSYPEDESEKNSSDDDTDSGKSSGDSDAEKQNFPETFYNDVGVSGVKQNKKAKSPDDNTAVSDETAGNVDLEDEKSMQAAAEQKYNGYYEDDLIAALKNPEDVYEFHIMYIDHPTTTYIVSSSSEDYYGSRGGGGGSSGGSGNPQSSGYNHPDGLGRGDVLKPDAEHMTYYPNWKTGHKKPETVWRCESLTDADMEYYLAKAAESNGGPLTALQRNVLLNALTYVGVVPYYWGGYWGNQGHADGTNHYGAYKTAIDGLDCAGFVRTIWHYASPPVELPSGTGNQERSGLMTKINKSEMKPGDPVYSNEHVMTYLYSENGQDFYVGAANTDAGCSINMDPSIDRAYRVNAADW